MKPLLIPTPRLVLREFTADDAEDVASQTFEVLWEKPLEEKGLLAADIRKRMARGEPWEAMVPLSVASRMHAWEIPSRLRKLLHPGDRRRR